MSGPVNFSWGSLVDHVLRQAWPPSCLACGLPGDGDSDRDLCPACLAALPWNLHACRRCALPLPPHDAGMACGECLSRASPLETVRAAFAYTAPLDRLLPMFKFHQSLATGRLLSGLMADTLIGAAVPDAVLVPIPLHRARLRQRGYDQALELAAPLARRLHLRCDPTLLSRPKATAAQSRLDKTARRRNLHGAFSVRGPGALPARIVLIDDVMTTGATLEAAACALRAAGATRVDAWVCARVP